MRWLVVSVLVSAVLTVALNVWLRTSPDAGRRVVRTLAERASPAVAHDQRSDHRVRVHVPWKAMIVASLVLTVVVNVVLWLR